MAPHGSAAHKNARAAALTRYIPGVTRCALGGEPLTQPPRLLDLAHDDDDPTGTRYLGLSCRRCNRGVHRRHGHKGNRNVPKPGVDPSRREQRELERQRRRQEIERARRARRRRIIVPDEPFLPGPDH